MINFQKNNKQKPCYILLHGAWHASWCWRYIVPLLMEEGYSVYAPDLPGHGMHEHHCFDINLNTYLIAITDLIHAINRPVILVGHSMAGVIISQLAENMPNDIQQLIYVAAFVPKNEQCLLEQAKQSRSTMIAAEMLIDSKQNEIVLKSSANLKALFYHQCTSEDVSFALSQLQKEPFQPFIDSIHITSERFGRIKKRYIECTEDRVLMLKDQRRIQRLLSCEVVSLASDHSPFFSHPIELAQAMMSEMS